MSQSSSLHFSIFLLGCVIIIQIHCIVTAYAGGWRFRLPANIYSYHGTYQYMYYWPIITVCGYVKTQDCFSLSYFYSFSLFSPYFSLSFIPSLFLIFSFSFLSSLYLNFLPFLLPFSPLLSCLSSLALSLSLINISQFLTCTSFSSVVVAALWFCIGIVPLGLWALIKQQTNINTMRQH